MVRSPRLWGPQCSDPEAKRGGTLGKEHILSATLLLLLQSGLDPTIDSGHVVRYLVTHTVWLASRSGARMAATQSASHLTALVALSRAWPWLCSAIPGGVGRSPMTTRAVFFYALPRFQG